MRNRKLIFTTVLAIIAVTFNACLEEPEPVLLDVVVDAFAQKKVLNGEEKYAVAFWSIANKSLESVTVEGPDDESWDLENNDGSAIAFSLLPDTAQYTDSMPMPGVYIYTATSTQSNEPPLIIKDTLENKDLNAVTIDSTRFSDSKLTIKWTAVEEVDEYVIRLYDDSENLMFLSPYIANNKTEYSFGKTDGGWTHVTYRPTSDKSYRLELLALLYESNSTSTNKGYNLQFISIATNDVVWSE